MTAQARRPHGSHERCGVDTRRVAKDLTGLRQRWALVGGFAVSARSEPRFTRDVDIVVAVANDDAAESLVRQLLTQQYHLLASVEQDAARRLAAVRLGATADTAANVVVDLLSRAVASNRRLRRLPRRSRSCPI